MDKLDKALRRFIPKERKQIRDILIRIKTGNFKGLDVRKLEGRKDIYRVRKGNLRIIYMVGKSGRNSVLAIERRTKGTYRNI